MSLRLRLTILSLGLCACSDSGTDSRRDLDETLVGSWRYTSTNVFDLFGERLRTFFSGLQLSPEEIEEAVSQTVRETRESFNVFNPDEVLTFGADGRWSSNVVGAGKWWVEEEGLSLTGAGTGNTDITYRYSIDGNGLTISLGRAQAVEILGESRTLPDDLLGLFSSIFEPDDLFIYNLSRLE